MTSSTYGTAELQGDASPSPPKSYRLSKVAKIALALVACGGAAAHPGTRKATTNLVMETYSGLNIGNHLPEARSAGSGDAAPVKSTPLKVQNLEAIVTGIENYLQATSASGKGSQTSRMMDTYGGVAQQQFLVRSARNPQDGKLTVAEVIEDLQDRVTAIEKYLQAADGSGGSGNSRASASRAMGLSGAFVDSFAARRRLKDHDAGSSGNSGTSRTWDGYNALKMNFDGDRSAGGGAPIASTSLKDQFQDLVVRVAAIKKYLQATSAPGGSGTSRGGFADADKRFGDRVVGWGARRA